MNLSHSHLILVFLQFVAFTNALVGITINDMYTPDSCGSACFSYFSAFTLDCSTFKNGKVSSTPACIGSSEDYMNSVAWCWLLQCTEISKVPNSLFEKYWYVKLGDTNMSYTEALSLGEPQTVLDPNSHPNLTEPGLVNDTLFYIYYRSHKDFFDSETYHSRMALSLVMMTWALVLFGILYNCIDKFHLDERFLPTKIRVWFRKYILFPAMFKEKCCVPIRLGEGFPIDYVPPRIVSITIFCYYVINIIFCAVPYRGFWEFLSYPHDTAGLMYTYVGNRTGVLAFANIPILILFASRNNIFQWLTGWSYATFQHYHRHVSIICVLETFVHSVLYTIKYVKKPYSAHHFATEAAKPYFWWGIIGTIACCIMPPLAILKIRLTAYEIFVFTHYVLAILFILGCAYHVKLRFHNKWGYPYWLYLSYSLWSFDFLVRILRVAYLKFKGCASKATVEVVDTESRTIKVTYIIKDSSQNCIGNYYYIYFFTVFPFFTSHPFTVAEWKHNSYKSGSLLNDTSSDDANSMDETKKNDTDEVGLLKNNQSISPLMPSDASTLSFYIQCMSGTTSKIFEKLEQNNFNPIEIRSVLEGPYGTYERSIFEDYDFLILLTGGIGNTVVINYLQCFLDYRNKYCFKNSHDVKLQILHLDKFPGRLQFLQNKLNDMIPIDAVDDVQIQFQDTSTNGRIDLEKYIKEKVNELEIKYPGGIRRIGVVSCGPAKFNDTCRHTVVQLQDNICKNTIVSYITDPFDW